jgi:enoyl-CoA hydratase
MLRSPGAHWCSMSALTVTTRSDAVAVLTFDQPGSKANVLTRELWTEFGAALSELAARTDLKGLVLASAKPGIFLAGADLKLLASALAPNNPEVRAFIELGLRVLEQLEALPFPTCAAIDGAALGGGLEVALACDVRVVGTGEKVQLGLPEVKLGLIPGWGGTQRLPRIVGLPNAAVLVTTGRSLDARALASPEFFDLVSEAPGHLELIDEAARSITDPEVAYLLGGRRETRLQPIPKEQIAAFQAPTVTTKAESEAMRVIVQGAALPLYDAIKLETEAFMRLAGSSESKRLMAEFLASRKK